MHVVDVTEKLFDATSYPSNIRNVTGVGLVTAWWSNKHLFEKFQM